MEVEMTDGMELGEFDLDSFIMEAAENEDAGPGAEEMALRQIVFVIDASNSMQGHKIGAVNDCVNNVLSKLRSMDRNQENAIEVSAMGFSTRLFRWTDQFVRASKFRYSYIEMADGLTDLNAALRELTDLTEHAMKKEAKRYVVLFSDGLFTEDYAQSMAQWAQSALFPEIKRITVAFDDDLNDVQSMAFFQAFAGGNAIVSINRQEQLMTALLE